MLIRSLRSRRQGATMVLSVLALSAMLDCGGSTSRDGSREEQGWLPRPEPSVEGIALFGMGVDRACSYLHMMVNVSAGGEARFSQVECSDTLRVIHERHLDRNDRHLLADFRASPTFARLQQSLARMDDPDAAQVPGACTEDEILLLRKVARPLLSLIRMPLFSSAGSEWGALEGIVSESVVVALSPLCDALSTDELQRVARVVASPAMDHSVAAAGETASWVERVIRRGVVRPG